LGIFTKIGFADAVSARGAILRAVASRILRIIGFRPIRGIRITNPIPAIMAIFGTIHIGLAEFADAVSAPWYTILRTIHAVGSII
jgi:hypothetical protein